VRFRTSLGSLKNQLCPPVVICGPSGVGKGTLIASILREFGPSKLGFAVSHTTRAPRPGEVGGEHYHFVSHAEFNSLVDQGEFLEHVGVHGNLYGTSLAGVRRVVGAGKVCVLDIDIQGVRLVERAARDAEDAAACASGTAEDENAAVPSSGRGAQGRARRLEGIPPPKFVFIAPPSIECLRNRLYARGTETREQIEGRVSAAAGELEWALESNEGRAVFDAVVVNEQLAPAQRELAALLRGWNPHLPARQPSGDSGESGERLEAIVLPTAGAAGVEGARGAAVARSGAKRGFTSGDKAQGAPGGRLTWTDVLRKSSNLVQ